MTPYYDEDGITIYCGDALAIEEWLAADVLISDPPYGIGWSRNANRARNSPPHGGIQGDSDTSVRDAALEMWGSRPAAVFGSFYAPYPNGGGLRQVLVWAKPDDSGVVGSSTGFRRDAEPVFLLGAWPVRPVCRSSVLRSVSRSIASVTVQTGHPHTKPTDLMTQLIEAGPNGVIADPFMGSGSTLLAARNLHREAIGVEVSEEYCALAVKRLAQGVLI